MKRTYSLWVLIDSKGRPWLYTSGHIVTFTTKREAALNAAHLDPKRQWNPAKVSLTLGKPDAR